MGPNFRNSLSVERRYRFDTYYAGIENENALKLLRGLVGNRGEQCVFIAGQSASGKTHLLYAVEREIHDAYPDQQTLFLRIDELRTLLVCALQDGDITEFWKYLLSFDLLIIDNTQYGMGLEDILQSLAAAYLQRGKRFILAGDYILSNLRKLPLHVITLTLPTYSTRRQIVNAKAREIGITISSASLERIAIKSKNARQIEGCLLQESLFNHLSENQVPTIIGKE